MKKAPLLAIAALTTLFAAATPALARDDGPSFSFGIMVGDGGYRGQPRYYERDRYVEREPCPEDRYRSYYGRPHHYGPRERVVIIDRGRDHWRREHWRHHRDWDWR